MGPPREWGAGLSLVAVRGLLEAAGRVVVSSAVATSVPAAGVGVIAARVPLSVGIVEAAPARARAGGGGGDFEHCGVVNINMPKTTDNVGGSATNETTKRGVREEEDIWGLGGYLRERERPRGGGGEGRPPRGGLGLRSRFLAGWGREEHDGGDEDEDEEEEECA